jgi:hypothetical protein
MKASERIPIKIRPDVIRITMYIKQNPNPNSKFLDWLFEVYNTYYSPAKCKKVSCRTDRNTVINQMYANVLIWKKEQQKKEEG